MDREGHDLTEAQALLPRALELTTLPQELDPNRFKDPVKSIDKAE